MATVSTAHTATGSGADLRVANGQSYTHTVTGTFVATWVVEYTKDRNNWIEVATGTGTSSETTVVIDLPDSGDIFIRSTVTAFTSGTCTVALADATDAIAGLIDLPLTDPAGTTLMSAQDGGINVLRRESQQKVITSGAKVGGTAGAVVDAANDKNSLVKVPASQTAATVVVKIPDLKVGDIITAFSVYGQLESAGGAVTVDAALRAQTAVAADNTDAAIGSGITQVAKTADYLINDAESGLSHTVIDGNSYYVLLTVTTAASTDVDVLGVTVTVTEV